MYKVWRSSTLFFPIAPLLTIVVFCSSLHVYAGTDALREEITLRDIDRHAKKTARMLQKKYLLSSGFQMVGACFFLREMYLMFHNLRRLFEKQDILPGAHDTTQKSAQRSWRIFGIECAQMMGFAVAHALAGRMAEYYTQAVSLAWFMRTHTSFTETVAETKQHVMHIEMQRDVDYHYDSLRGAQAALIEQACAIFGYMYARIPALDAAHKSDVHRIIRHGISIINTYTQSLVALDAGAVDDQGALAAAQMRQKMLAVGRELQVCIAALEADFASFMRLEQGENNNLDRAKVNA